MRLNLKWKNIKPLVFTISTILLMHILFMLLSGKTFAVQNPYNSYSRQAFTWLNGSLSLEENISWLEIAVFNGEYFISFPPFPSYLMLPFVLFFGIDTPDTLISLIVTLIGAYYAYKITCYYKLPLKYRVFLPVFLYCATNLWQITVDGWVWFIAQNLSITLTLAAFYYALKSKKGLAVFLLCAAVGCRPFQIVYFPLILLILLEAQEEDSIFKKIKKFLFEKIYCFFPAVILVISYCVLNFLRFGNIFEFGHNYLPEFTEAANGQFDFSYILQNFNSLFRLPEIDTVTHQLVFPRFDGVNIFIVFPIIIFYIVLFIEFIINWFKLNKTDKKINAKNVIQPLIIVLCCIHILLLLMHKTMGGSHFGHRYICDIMPAIFLGISARLKTVTANSGLETTDTDEFDLKEVIFWLLLFGGLIVNFTGVLNYYNSFMW